MPEDDKPKRRPGMRSAINAKCKDCIYDPLAGGTWRKQVEDCDAEGVCALWPVRPKSAKPRGRGPQDEAGEQGPSGWGEGWS